MFLHCFFISTFLFAAYCSPSCFAQIFQNMAPAWGIVQQNWNGHYGAADLSGDSSVGIPDLLMLLTFVGQSCL